MKSPPSGDGGSARSLRAQAARVGRPDDPVSHRVSPAPLQTTKQDMRIHSAPNAARSESAYAGVPPTSHSNEFGMGRHSMAGRASPRSMKPADVRRLIDDLLKEEALVLVGLVEIHDVPNMFVNQLFRCLTALRRQTLERIGADAASADNHATCTAGCRRPAIDDFLVQLGRNGK